MRLESTKGLAATTVAVGLILYSVSVTRSFGDEPSRLGRLFRMGNSGSTATSTSTSTSSGALMTTPPTSFAGQPALSTPLSTSPATASSPASVRVTPKPRVNKAVTEADPLVTRISLGRSDNGSQFGMLLQIFADGTVIDGEGVHHLTSDAMKPVVETVASGELGRLKGHCGGPAGDFIENVHIIVFDRSMGRLRASSFSYSGNPQGCDHAVHHLQKVLDELQTKLSSVAPPAVPTAPTPVRGAIAPPLPLTTTP